MYAFTLLVLFSFSFCLFVSSTFCHVDTDVCIYSTCAFLIVKWILMMIMSSATSSHIFTGYSARYIRDIIIIIKI